jgi:choice-of-anchor B domain-containing protein
MKMLARPLLFAAVCALVFPVCSAALVRPRGPLQCVGGLAGPYPCKVVDQASFVPLTDLSGASSVSVGTVLGWRHEASGREFALVSLFREISFVEVTDPENPEPVGEYRRDGQAIVGSIAVYQDHLYVSVATSEGAALDIVDLTRLLSANGPAARIPAEASHPLHLFGRLSIVPETGHAFLNAGVPSPFSIVGLDLSADPEAPEELFTWDPGPPYARQIECVLYHGPDSRFAGHEVCIGAAPRRSLVIYDVTPEHPVKLSRTFYKRYNHPWHATFTADHRFVLLSDSHDEYNPGFNTRTFLFDVSSLTAPSYFASYDGPTKGRDLHIEVRGRYAFLANASAGLRVLDLRQIAKGRLREVGSFDVEPDNNSANWFGAVSLDVLPSGTVILGSLSQGLYVLKPRL